MAVSHPENVPIQTSSNSVISIGEFVLRNTWSEDGLVFIYTKRKILWNPSLTGKKQLDGS